MKLVVNQTLIDYAVHGKGRYVLLLHGWGTNRESFKELTAELAKQFTCVTIDLPGFGQSEAPPVAWGLDDYAAFLHDFLLKQHTSTDLYAVVGHSNGGAIAMQALASGALSAEKLVLLGSAGIRNKVPVRKLALKIIAKTGKAVTKPLPKHLQKRLRGKLYSSIGSDMLLVPHMQETFQKTVGQDVTQSAARVKAQTLLIYGALDDQTPVADGQKLAKVIPHAKLEVIPEVGHFVHNDAPAEVQTLVRDFLQ